MDGSTTSPLNSDYADAVMAVCRRAGVQGDAVLYIINMYNIFLL
jgi:hypothetical protein